MFVAWAHDQKLEFARFCMLAALLLVRVLIRREADENYSSRARVRLNRLLLTGKSH